MLLYLFPWSKSKQRHRELKQRVGSERYQCQSGLIVIVLIANLLMAACSHPTCRAATPGSADIRGGTSKSGTTKIGNMWTTTQPVVTVPFTLNDVGQMVVHATVPDASGHETELRLIVDTGASTTVLDWRAANALGIPISTMATPGIQLHTSAGRIFERQLLPSLTLGDKNALVVVQALDVSVNGQNGLYADNDFHASDGFLGADFLSAAPFYVDIPNQTLVFYAPGKSQSDLLKAADMKSATAIPLSDYNATYSCSGELSVAGKSVPTSMVVDTGSYASCIGGYAANTLPIAADAQPTDLKFVTMAELGQCSVFAHVLRIGSIAVDITAESTQYPASASNIVDRSTVALDVLDHFKVLFDLSNDVMYLQPRPIETYNVPSNLNEHGSPLIQASVGGAKIGSFFLNSQTGPECAIRGSALKSVESSVCEQGHVFFSGRDTKYVVLRDVAFGPLVFNRLFCVVYDDWTVEGDTVGWIGTTIVKEFSVLVDYKSKRASFLSPGNIGPEQLAQLGMAGSERIDLIRGTVFGTYLVKEHLENPQGLGVDEFSQVTIANDSTFVSQAAASSLALKPSGDPLSIAEGKVELFPTHVSCQIGGLKLDDPRAYYSGNPNTYNPQSYVGSKFFSLTCSRMLFDPGDGCIYALPLAASGRSKISGARPTH